MLFCYRFFEIKCLNVLDKCVIHNRTGIDFILGSEDPQGSNSNKGNSMPVVANLGFLIVSQARLGWYEPRGIHWIDEKVECLMEIREEN